MEGTADVSSGALNVVAGSVVVVGKFALGTAVGGGAAVVDGVKDFYVGVRDGSTEKKAIGGIKTLAGAAMLSSAWCPPVAAAGAVVLLGTTIYENRHAIKHAAKWMYNGVASWFD